MEDVIYGLIAIVAGAIFCFRGFLALRLIIPIWGFFVGFSVGAGLIANITDEGFLSSVLGWVVGFAVAVCFAVLAYLYYAVSVVIAMGAIGFTLGASLMMALDVTWTWVIVLVGVVVGVALAGASIVADLPLLLLMILSSLAGASAITGGVMLLVGAIETQDFTDEGIIGRADDPWWWYVIYIVLAIAGIIAQARMVEDLKVSMRQAWEADRGGQRKSA
ncbi:MAG TPA: DUF4203 domain-containing protein [Acidimicrobiales bacterium]